MEAEMGAPTFWDHSERAQRHIAKLNGLRLRARHLAQGGPRV